MSIAWKDIKGYEGLYKISNTGLVKSLARHRGCMYTGDKILNGYDQGSGYIVYDLYDGETRKKLYAHRLVAIHFIDNPNNYDYVNHINQNRSDNNYKNLEWCTSSYNNRYNDAHLKRGQHLKEYWADKIHPNSKKVICLTTGKVFNSATEASNYYNIKTLRSHIGRMCKGTKKYEYLGKLEDGTKLTWMYYEDWLSKYHND